MKQIIGIKRNSKVKTYEFNKGFITAIGLFLAHERMINIAGMSPSLVIYGASDHLIDAECPKQLPKKLRETFNKLRDEVVRRRLDSDWTNQEYDQVFLNFKLFLAELDEHLFKTKVVIHYP